MKATTKRTNIRFRVAEYASGRPWIVMEQMERDDLALFKNMVGFEPHPGTTFDGAQEIAQYLNSKLRGVSETTFPAEA